MALLLSERLRKQEERRSEGREGTYSEAARDGFLGGLVMVTVLIMVLSGLGNYWDSGHAPVAATAATPAASTGVIEVIVPLLILGLMVVVALLGRAKERGELRLLRRVCSVLAGAIAAAVVASGAIASLDQNFLHMPLEMRKAVFLTGVSVATALGALIGLLWKENPKRGFFRNLHDLLERLGKINSGIWSVIFCLVFMGIGGAIAAGAGWLIWWNWPAPDATAFERYGTWGIIALIALFGWLLGGSLAWASVRELISMIGKAPRLGDADVHGTADLAEVEEAAKAARGQRKSAGSAGLNLDY